jgi:hypothetical protein
MPHVHGAYVAPVAERGTDNAELEATALARYTALVAYVDDLETRLTAARAGYLDNINNAQLLNISAAILGRIDAAISSRLGGTPELIDISIDGGTTQVLAVGFYVAKPMALNYTLGRWDTAGGHLEIFAGGAWRNWTPIDSAATFQPLLFHSDGTNVRFANGAGAGTSYWLVGMRVY